jgi:hypothetical protein
VYDEATGRKGTKLSVKLPGWIVAKTIAMLRQREGYVDGMLDDASQVTTSVTRAQSYDFEIYSHCAGVVVVKSILK